MLKPESEKLKSFLCYVFGNRIMPDFSWFCVCVVCSFSAENNRGVENE